MTLYKTCLLAFVGALASSSSACSCTDDFRFGLAVTVSGPDGNPICDATVVALDGTHEETLSASSGTCVYMGAGERAGRYTVTASKPGLNSASIQVEVGEEACHVRGEHVSLQLSVP